MTSIFAVTRYDSGQLGMPPAPEASGEANPDRPLTMRRSEFRTSRLVIP
jgi:hypothetical protein